MFLSTLGLYEAYVTALAAVDLGILVPMLAGLAVGAVVISFAMSRLFKRYYSVTFSVIFGIFLSMIPNMLSAECRLGGNGVSVLSVVVMVLGFGLSWYLGDLEGWNRKLRKWFKK